jgi:tetratricopeptide (TPR) repeat protein
MAYTLHGFSCYYMGHFREAIHNLTQGAAFGERMNYFAWNAVSQYYLGESHLAMGQYQPAQSYYERAIWFLQNNIWFPSFLNFNRIALARTELFHQSQQIQVKNLIRHAAQNKLKLFEGQAQRKMGDIFLNSGGRGVAKAEKWIQRAIASDQRNGVMFELGQDHALLAAYFKQQGDMLQARRCLKQAQNIFENCGVELWVKQCQNLAV